MFQRLIDSALPRVRPALFVAPVILVSAACTPEMQADAPEPEASALAVSQPNTLTEAEKAAGWRLLFDGESFTGWRGLGRADIPTAHWTIDAGTIKKIPSGEVAVQADGQPTAGGDLITVDTYGDYEFSWEWKVSPGGNSGVKYNVSEEMSMAHPPKHAALGFEYQILDDERHPDANAGVDGNRKSAGLYDLIGADASKPLRPVGEWNEARIVFRGNHGEHWLNGVKVVEYDLDSADFKARLAASKYKDIEGFADRRVGHIVLQDHNDAVWYRNLKIRELK